MGYVSSVDLKVDSKFLWDLRLVDIQWVASSVVTCWSLDSGVSLEAWGSIPGLGHVLIILFTGRFKHICSSTQKALLPILIEKK